MRQHPDHHDAELLLRLYDLRREAKIREARAWFAREFRADSADELNQRYARGTKENDYFRMVLGYWEMAASIVNHGLIQEDFFFENTGEFWAVWSKVQRLTTERREKSKDTLLWTNLETLSDKYEQWMEKRAPGALDALRLRLELPASKK